MDETSTVAIGHHRVRKQHYKTTHMDFKELASARYSCREMSSRTVEENKINTILEMARLAPTAVNKQPFHLWVIRSEDALANVAQTTRSIFGAKVIIAVGCKSDEAWVRRYDGHNYAEIDAAIVATHIMMGVADLGLATTWVGSFDAPKMRELFPEMQGYELIALFPIGYASDAPAGQPSARHSQRKEMSELVTNI